MTDEIVDLNESRRNASLTQLLAAGLIEQDESTVDTHPLVREYFVNQLRGSQAWLEAHGRIFEFLKGSVEYQPAALASLQPLYQAVYHGCAANRHEEALKNVYQDRILRGTQEKHDDRFFSLTRFGVSGAEMSAVACFFEKPWSRPSPLLAGMDQAWLLNSGAFLLRSQGRLKEAVEPMRASMLSDIQREHWEGALRSAINLSELELTLGDLRAARETAKMAIGLTGRAHVVFLRMVALSTLAHALTQAGEAEAAARYFEKAEKIECRRTPQYPLLYSVRGFCFCDLLLEEAERMAGSRRCTSAIKIISFCNEVENRADQAFRIASERGQILDIALANLLLIRAQFYRTFAELEMDAADPNPDLLERIDIVVAGLRETGHQPFVPHGLLTRSWLRFAFGNSEGAQTDLDEAHEIAKRGSMRLHLADVALYRARLFHDREAVAEARRLIDECGYCRRLPEIENLEAILRRP